MLAKESLKDLIHKAGFNRLDKLLCCLAVDVATPKTIQNIKDFAMSSGLRSVRGWNVSSTLSRSSGLAVRTNAGWELTSRGCEHVRKLAGSLIGSPAPVVASSLRGHLSRIRDKQVSLFVEEAIKCFEGRLYRAAVVLSWVGALALLYKQTVDNHLAAFNAEATRRDPKWKLAKTSEDLARMKEKDFLDIIEYISVIGKSVKQELENCLRLRNGCGHPNNLQVSENRVAAHVESLLLNIFARFN